MDWDDLEDWSGKSCECCTSKAYLSAQHLNPENVQGLPTDIFSTHIDDTFHPEFCTDCGSCHSMLSCASLGNDTGLANPPSKQNLADRVVDFV